MEATSAFPKETILLQSNKITHPFHANMRFLAMRFQKRKPCFPRLAEAVNGVLIFLALAFIDAIVGVPILTGVIAPPDVAFVALNDDSACPVCFTGVIM